MQARQVRRLGRQKCELVRTSLVASFGRLVSTAVPAGPQTSGNGSPRCSNSGICSRGTCTDTTARHHQHFYLLSPRCLRRLTFDQQQRNRCNASPTPHSRVWQCTKGTVEPLPAFHLLAASPSPRLLQTFGLLPGASCYLPIAVL